MAKVEEEMTEGNERKRVQLVFQLMRVARFQRLIKRNEALGVWKLAGLCFQRCVTWLQL